MKTEFLLTESDIIAEDFAVNITEMLLDLENNFGSPEELAASVQEMYIGAAPSATETQLQEFQKITRFFELFSEFLRENEEPFFDTKYLLRSLTDGRVIVNEETGQPFYFDHPMHQHYFNQENIKKKWHITETK